MSFVQSTGLPLPFGFFFFGFFPPAAALPSFGGRFARLGRTRRHNDALGVVIRLQDLGLVLLYLLRKLPLLLLIPMASSRQRDFTESDGVDLAQGIRNTSIQV